MAARDPRSGSGEPGDAGRSRPAKADWRRPAPHSPAGAPPGKKRGPAWQVKPDQAYEDARRWHRIRRAGWALLAVALVAAFVWYIMITPKRTPLLVMAVTGYSGSLSLAIPPNAWAKEDLDNFSRLDKEEAIVKYIPTEPAQGKKGVEAFEPLRDAIGKELEQKHKALIVYLGVHGVVNGDGEPCLLLPGESSLTGISWLPLKELLPYLFPKDAPPAEKLLILDCSRMDANWRLGLLYNGFADRLQGVVDSAGIPDLAVLNSTSPGQIGWASPEELRGSVFAYFVAEGLRGAADRRQEGGSGDRDVSLKELYRYVRAHVSQWVLENRADVQQPMLVPKDAEIDLLVHAKSPAPAKLLPATESVSRRWEDDLNALWTRHDELRATTPWRTRPLQWEEFQQGLLRLEQLAAAGSAYDDQYVAMRDDLRVKAERLDHQGLPNDLTAYSLPLRRQLVADASVRKRIDEEAKTLRAQWSASQQRFEAAALPDLSYLATAGEVWRQCIHGADPKQWPALLKLVDASRLRAGSSGDVVEIHFLRMLDAYLDPLTMAQQRGLVQRVLAVRDWAERAAAPEDERAHWWVQAAVDQADDTRRRAEDLLFVGTPKATGDAAGRFDALVAADGRAGAYVQAVGAADRVARAFAVRDRAWAETPYYAQWLLARLRPDDEAHRLTLQKLITSTHVLAAELDQSIANGNWSPTWEKTLLSAEEALQGLSKSYGEECTRLWERAPENRQTLREITVVLSVPLLSGEQRNDLWRKYWRIAAPKPLQDGEAERGPPKAEAKAEDDAAPDKTEAKAESYRVAPSVEREPQAEYLGRLRGVHPAIDTLVQSRLGVEELPSVRAIVSPTAPQAPEETDRRVEALARQGQCLRELLAGPDGALVKQCALWQKESEQKLDLGDRSPQECRAGWSRADRLIRTAAPLMDLAGPRWSKPEDDPPHQLRRFDLHRLLVWQAMRSLDDFWGPPPGSPDASPFFAVAAEGYLKSAGLLCPAGKRFRYGEVNLAERLELRRTAAKAPVEPKPADLSIKKPDPQAPKSQEFLATGEVSATIAENLPEGTAAIYLRDPAAPSREEQTFAMLIQGEAGRAEFRRIAVEVRAGQREASQKYSLPSDDPRLRDPRLEAVGWYRGHLRPAPFTATPPDYELVYTPPKYPLPQVTVFGEGGPPTPVVFILDCSGSMDQPVGRAIERKGAAGAGVPAAKSAAAAQRRFDLARGALREIVARLAQSGGAYHVGLMAYGHRVGWEKGQLVVFDPNRPGQTMPRPPDVSLVPAEDVELLRPLGLFGAADLQDLGVTLEKLRPLGETPLYLSIRSALAELRRYQPDPQTPRVSRRHIFVITDGVDQVWEKGPGKRTLQDDVLQELKRPENRDVSLDIVGFNLSDWALLRQAANDLWEGEKLSQINEALDARQQQQEAAETAADQVDSSGQLAQTLASYKAKRGELEQLAKQTKHLRTPGKGEEPETGFYQVEDMSGVLQALDRSRLLRKTTFTVQRVQDDLSVATNDLGKHVEVKQLVGVRIPYRVQVDGPAGKLTEEIALEGGEALEIWLSNDGSRLEHHRYGENVSRFARPAILPDPADPENPAKGFYVAAHIPYWRQAAVAFEISIQHKDPAKFSPRPEEAWVQIRPLLARATDPAPPYVFYDLAFEPGRPVPVLACLAPDWPAEAKEAEVQLWFKMKKTLPDPRHIISVGEFRKRGSFRLQETPSVEFAIDTRPGKEGTPYQVAVTERYSKGSPLHAVRVEMDPAPERIARQYNRKAGTALHTFFYDAAVAPQVDNFKVVLTPHSRLTEGAATLPAPFKVVVGAPNR